MNPMPPRRVLPLRGARDDPKAWPPSSAPLRLVVPMPRPRLLGVASPRPRPPFIRARERVSDFSGPWRSPNLSQRCCATSAWLFDFCNRLSCDARALFPWARPSHDEGGCPSGVATPGCAFALAPFPLCGGQAAPCAAASHARLSDARPCDRTLSAEHGDPLTRTLLAWRKRHERVVGRWTSRPGTKHVDGLPPIRAPRETCVGAFQLDLLPSISCHRRRERAGMDPVRSDSAGRGCRRVTSPRRAAACVHRDAFHHLEPTHGGDCSLL